MKIVGVGIYGAYDEEKYDVNIQYKWKIENEPNGEEIIAERKELCNYIIPKDDQELNENMYFKFLFPPTGQEIIVKRN
jgi:hypothetical protein